MSDDKTIFRVLKNKENPFVMIDRRVLENPALSWKAKGLLAYLLSRPDDWEVWMSDLIKRSTDGEYATRAAVNELITAGHIIRRAEREKGKFVRFILEVYESPQLIDDPKPFRGFPQMDNPQVGNLALNNNDSNDTELNNIDSPISPEGTSRDIPKPEPINDLANSIMGNFKVTPFTPEGETIIKNPGAFAALQRHQQRVEAGEDDLSWLPEYLWPLARAFIKYSDVRPMRTIRSYWIKSLQDIYSSRYNQDDIKVAVERVRKDGLTIKSPQSIVYALIDPISNENGGDIIQADQVLTERRALFGKSGL